MSNHETYQPSAEDAAKNKAFVEAQLARDTEPHIQRHSLLARVTHGVVAISCILLCISGAFVFAPPLAALIGSQAVFAIRMSHRVLGCIFILMPLFSMIRAPKGAWHIVKEDFLSKWDSDDKKWMMLFMPYLFLARWLHMPDQHLNKSGQRFADGMLIILCLLMAVTGVALTLGTTVIEMSAEAHAIWILLHDIGFFLIVVFGMAHIFLGGGIFQPYKGCYKLMFGPGTVSTSDALYHWGHWAREEIESGKNLVEMPRSK